MAVNYCKVKKRWRAELSHQRERIHAGYFKTKEEAVKVFNDGMAEILKGNIPESLLRKIHNRKLKPIKKKTISRRDLLPVEREPFVPEKTIVVLYPESERPIVIESMPFRVQLNGAQSDVHVSLSRVKWLESGV